MVAGPLARLAPKQRAAVTLHYLHDLTDREAAAAMGCTTPAFRGHLRRGVAAMRSELLLDMGPTSAAGAIWSES
jgi:DNA-directed RNA polymerase specialized sigma24 family protein